MLLNKIDANNFKQCFFFTFPKKNKLYKPNKLSGLTDTVPMNY